MNQLYIYIYIYVRVASCRLIRPFSHRLHPATRGFSFHKDKKIESKLVSWKRSDLLRASVSENQFQSFDNWPFWATFWLAVTVDRWKLTPYRWALKSWKTLKWNSLRHHETIRLKGMKKVHVKASYKQIEIYIYIYIYVRETFRVYFVSLSFENINRLNKLKGLNDLILLILLILQKTLED